MTETIKDGNLVGNPDGGADFITFGSLKKTVWVKKNHTSKVNVMDLLLVQ